MGQPLKTADLQAFLNRAGTKPELVVDGVSGVVTQTALSEYLENLADIPEADFGETMLGDDYEGLDSPPDWPGESSGVTIGGGYDLGYETTFPQDWADTLSKEVQERLTAVIGLKGGEAQSAALHLKDISIPRAAAKEVLDKVTFAKVQHQTLSIYPELTHLLPDAQVALMSLVYNRGTALKGYDRAQMRAIQTCVAQGDYVGIQNNLRAMIPLWAGSSIANDMHRRRNAEADLVLRAWLRTRTLPPGADVELSEDLSSTSRS